MYLSICFYIYDTDDVGELHMTNIFVKPVEFYTRDIDVVPQYIQQMAVYSSKMLGISIEEATERIRVVLNKELKDPMVTFYERDENGNRSVHEESLLTYIDTVKQSKDVLTPTFTTYVNEHRKESLCSIFLDEKATLRNKAKNEAYAYESAGNMDMFTIKNNEQTKEKRTSNSVSGSFVTKASVLNNPTGHSTLTSITRTLSSLSNASNEKLISGNRHYYNPEVTLNNLITIVAGVDMRSLSRVLDKYELHYPTVDETITTISYSSDLYWRGSSDKARVFGFLYTLDPVELAAIVYVGDLHHIRVFNPEFTRQFIKELSAKLASGDLQTKHDLIAYIRQSPQDILNIAHQICFTETKGMGKRYDEMSILALQTLSATIKNLIETVSRYSDFIEVFFLSQIIPANTAVIPNMVRRTVLMSDTDSTVFSVDEYVMWYFGEMLFTDAAIAVGVSVMFIATQVMVHVLALFSANIGAVKEKTFTLSMKPEFSFPVFAQTPIAKHYFTMINVKEGNVYAKPSFEHKGVGLKNSAVPDNLIHQSQKDMNDILLTVFKGGKISIIEEITKVYDVELGIIKALNAGNVSYFKKARIKNGESYVKSDELSPYQHHNLWEVVFSPRYGQIDTPPYSVIKIPTTLCNITSLKRWLDTMEDREMADRLSVWLSTRNKTNLPTMYLSIMYVRAFGIPEEIKAIMDVRKIVLDLTYSNRLVLATLGYFQKKGMLVSETFSPEI